MKVKHVDDETCGDCYWRERDGYCRRFPPSVTANRSTMKDLSAEYPEVDKNTKACGEFEED